MKQMGKKKKKPRKTEMSFRSMHDRARGRTGLQRVMTDRGLGQDSLKYRRKSKMPHKM